MGTKENPAKFDCYANALPDEPMFILLARDPAFYELVTAWADKRERDVQCGERPLSDMAMVHKARDCAFAGAEWRRAANGKWRRKTPSTVAELEAILNSEDDRPITINPDGSVNAG